MSLPSWHSLLSNCPELTPALTDLNDKIRNPLAVIQSASELLDIYGKSMTEAERQALFNSIYEAVIEIKAALPKDYL